MLLLIHAYLQPFVALSWLRSSLSCHRPVIVTIPEMPGPHLSAYHLKAWDDVHGCDYWVNTYSKENDQYTMGWHIHHGGVFGPLIGEPCVHLIGHTRWHNHQPVEGWLNLPSPTYEPYGADLTPTAVLHWWYDQDDHYHWHYYERKYPHLALIDFLQFAAEYWPDDYCSCFGLSDYLLRYSEKVGWVEALGAWDIAKGTPNAGKGVLVKGADVAYAYKGMAENYAEHQRCRVKGRGEGGAPKGKGPGNFPEEWSSKDSYGKGKNKGKKGRNEGKNEGKGKHFK